jgi:hypothetical protein
VMFDPSFANVKESEQLTYIDFINFSKTSTTHADTSHNYAR